MKDKIKLNGFEYKTEIDEPNNDIKLFLDHQKETTDNLYKFYSLSKNSVSATINRYLFSSHPMMNNDKYDCSGDLIDYSKIELSVYISHLVDDLKLFSKEKVEELFNSDQKWVLERTVSDLNQIKLYMKFGIISLTEKIDDTLMWAYYSQNSGFAIKLEKEQLPKSFYGPFPINYVPKLEKIDFTEYQLPLCIHYQANVKDEIWKNESEWRYLTFNPNGKYHPFYWKKDIKSRKFFYNNNALKEIILGYDFFNPKEIDYKKRTAEYDIVSFNGKKGKYDKKLKRQLLTFIVKEKITSCQMFRHRYEYKLGKKEIKIEKISANKFKIYNTKET